jgi:predicted metal-dependent enzyme (double-stranded beta helix superfamily)
METPAALARFIATMDALLERERDEPRVLSGCRDAMRMLVARDDWLPEAVAKPHPEFFQQYLLHCDARERYCVVSFVWGPGQGTPVHDHTVWGVIGMLRGGETCERYERAGDRVVAVGSPARLHPGETDAVSPAIGDIHRVANAYDDRVSISIHAYGANIGKVRRHVFDVAAGTVKEFVSGYANG